MQKCLQCHMYKWIITAQQSGGGPSSSCHTFLDVSDSLEKTCFQMLELEKRLAIVPAMQPSTELYFYPDCHCDDSPFQTWSGRK